MKNVLLSFLLAFASLPCRGADFELQIKESLLNDGRLIAGTKVFSGSVNLGVTSQPYSVTVHSLEIEAEASGLTYQAVLKVTFLGINHFIDVEGDLDVSMGPSQITFQLESLNLPIKLDVPFHGEVTLFTIQTPLTHSLSWTFRPVADLKIDDSILHGRLVNLAIEPRDGELVLKGDVSFQ